MNGSIACRWGRQDQPMAPMMWQCIAVLVLAGALHVSHAEIGEDCFSVLDCSAVGAECHFGYSTCDKGKCQCPNGYYHHEADNTCYIAIPHDGEGCERDEDCQALTVGAICTTDPTRLCECPPELPDYTLYGEIGYCHRIACTGDNECLGNFVHDGRATCVVGITDACICNEEYTPNDIEPGAIVCEAALEGGDCTDPLICEEGTGLTCQSDACACTGENVNWDPEHVMCIDQGAIVSAEQDCVEGVYDSQAYCEGELTCDICLENSNNAQCQAERGTVGLGEPCVMADAETERVCATGNAVCTEQYVGCESGRCNCEEGFYQKAGQCMPDLQCLVDDDCDGTLDGVVTCDNPGGTCVCSDVAGVIEQTIEGRDYCGRELDAACGAEDNVAECLAEIFSTGSGVCTGGNCACAAGYMPEGNICVRLTLGEACDGDNEWCRNNMECIDEACACAADHTWSEDHQLCIHDQAVSDLAVDQECNEDAGETQNMEYCSYWLECDVCPEDGVIASDRCLSVPGQDAPDEGIDLGVDCPFNGEEVATQCAAENAECAVAFEDCERGVCSCMEGYYVDANGDCSEDRTCVDGDCSLTLPGGRCNQRGNCVCDEDEGKQEYEHNGVTYCGIPDGGACLPPGDPSACISEMILQGSTQCTGLGGNGNCACEDVYQTAENTCVPYTHGDNCDGGLGRPNMVCGEGLVCQDDGDGVETCQCDGNNNEWRGAYGMCIHSEATINVEEDQPCDEANEDDAARAYCEPELVCAVCPGTDETICQVVPEVPVEDPVTTPPPQDGTTPDPDDGTDPTDPDGGAVHMHVSTVLMVLAGILACYQIY